MKWKDLSYWLRGGLIGLVAYPLLFHLLIFIAKISYLGILVGLLFLSFFVYILTIPIILLNMLFDNIIIDMVTSTIIFAVSGFIIGAVLGFIIQKIRRK